MITTWKITMNQIGLARNVDLSRLFFNLMIKYTKKSNDIFYKVLKFARKMGRKGSGHDIRKSAINHIQINRNCLYDFCLYHI